MDFENILKKCGDFHKYQFLLLALFAIISIFTSMHYFTQTIISFVPEHWCYHEKLENKTFGEIRDIYSQFESPSCTRLDDIINGSNVIVSEIKCEKWIYNYDYGYRSINTELNWVCDSSYKSSLGQSTFFIGSAIGTLLFGMLADKYGRLPLLVVANLSAFIGDFSTTFSTGVIGFAICRFISGMAADYNICLMYIIVLEYIRPSMKIVCLNLGLVLCYSIGLTSTPWLAVLTGYWKYYLYCTSIPLILIIGVYFLISESAQWLVTNNDVDGAIRRLRKIAKFNGKYVSDDDFQKFRKFCENQQNTECNNEYKAYLFDLFKTPKLRRKTIILFYLAMVTTLGYNSVARNVQGIGLSPFLIFTFCSMTLIPAALFLSFLQNKIGRKGMVLTALTYCGLTILVSGICKLFEHSNSQQTNIIMFSTLQTLSRLGVSISYESVSQFSFDLIPTCVRGQGVAAMHVSGSAISFLSAPLLYLATYFKALPSFILAGLFISGGLLCLLLPETLNKPIAKTLIEAEDFGKYERALNFACIKRSESKDLEDQIGVDPVEKSLLQ